MISERTKAALAAAKRRLERQQPTQPRKWKRPNDRRLINLCRRIRDLPR
jgi:hypothetical protein